MIVLLRTLSLVSTCLFGLVDPGPLALGASLHFAGPVQASTSCFPQPLVCWVPLLQWLLKLLTLLLHLDQLP